jgi:leader peptidase (prepilin peptidase) / N-methyltransferase
VPSSRLAGGGEEAGAHLALNDMAAAFLDASLLAMLAAVTLSDLRTRLIPDRFLVAGLACVLAAIVVTEPGTLPGRLLAGLAAAGFLLVAALLRPDDMGLGDVKLAGVLGVYLGPAVLGAMMVAFASGSIAGIVLVVRHGWGARRLTIPFAPFLALGALVAIAPAAS